MAFVFAFPFGLTLGAVDAAEDDVFIPLRSDLPIHIRYQKYERAEQYILDTDFKAFCRVARLNVSVEPLRYMSRDFPR